MAANESSAYTPTGWRIVGHSAQAIAERAAAYGVDRLRAGGSADTLYAVQFTLDPRVAGRPTVERLLDAITNEIRRTWADCPRLLRDEEVDRPPSRFGGLRFDVLARPGKEWLGEVIWRSVHPVVAGAPITVRVLIEEKPSYTRASVRVTADCGLDSVRGYVGAGQAQPAFIRLLRQEGLTPLWLGGPLEARRVRDGDITDLVHSTLPSPERTTPVVVLAPLEEGGYVVDPEDLAWELLGRAKLHVLREHRQSFDLTDTIGDRRMSCYWGAARAYLPGWSRNDDPFDHPLLIGERLGDPVMRAAWLGQLGIWLGTRLSLPPSIEERAAVEAPPAAIGSTANDPGRTVADSRRPAAAATPPALPSTPVPSPAPQAEERPSGAMQLPAVDYGPQLEVIVTELRKLGTVIAHLSDEIERLRTISAVRSSSTSAIERRLGRLEDILEEAFPDGRGMSPTAAPAPESPADDGSADEESRTLVQVVGDAAEAYVDALVFLEAASASAADSPYEDPERVHAILEAMARVARRRRDGLLGTSLREAFADLGIEYRSAIAKTTPARLREQYRFAHGGDLVEAEEHIVLGKTYDPRRCLRIYFTSRVADDPRFIVAHVGRHFEVITST
jgi:hypothetical protein